VTASASVQDNWRTMLARTFARDLAGVWDTHKNIIFFKIGEGGGSGGTPITPDSAFIDILGEGEAKTGLASFSNGVAVVNGVGTSFDTEFAINDWIKPGARTTGAPLVSPYSPGYPGTEYDEWAQISGIPSATVINLTAPYAGVSTPENRVPKKATAAQGPLFTFRKFLVNGDVIFFGHDIGWRSRGEFRPAWWKPRFLRDWWIRRRWCDGVLLHL